jgi:UDP-N-acetylglucosamine--N-acetylmuramyl-(pentapeptide) pyrophosphoryl-undecaprenol N-acetylglucosamine transferase
MVTNKQLPFIYISGGSLGSHSINTKVINSLNSFLEHIEYFFKLERMIILKIMRKHTNKEKLIDEYKERVVIKKYIDSNSIGYVLNGMDIFVGRAGANTVYEIGVLKKFALFIPIPWATHNEQYLNAKVLSDIGTANILEEKYLNDAILQRK